MASVTLSMTRQFGTVRFEEVTKRKTCQFYVHALRTTSIRIETS